MKDRVDRLLPIAIVPSPASRYPTVYYEQQTGVNRMEIPQHQPPLPPPVPVLALSLLPAFAMLLLVGGCTTSGNLDREPAFAREHLLGRRYVLQADAPFPRAKSHPPFQFTGAFPALGAVVIGKGTIVQIVHVESIRTENGDYGMGVNQVQAIALTGPLKGERISVGSVPCFNSKYAEFETIDLPAGLEESSGRALVPLPEEPPAWLDVGVVPPLIKPVSSEILLQAIQNSDWIIRWYALGELLRRDAADPRTGKACEAALFDEVSELRRMGLSALMRNHVESHLDALVKRFSDPAILYCEANRITLALVAAGKPGMVRAANLLLSSDSIIVMRATDVLQRFGSAARADVPQLVDALHRDPTWGEYMNPTPASSANQTVYQLQISAHPIYQAIYQIDLNSAFQIAAEVLHTRDASVRLMTVYEMSTLYNSAAESKNQIVMDGVISSLKEATRDRDPDVRSTASEALSRIARASARCSCQPLITFFVFAYFPG